MSASEAGYLQIVEVVFFSEIPHADKMVYGALLSFAWQSDWCHPGVETIHEKVRNTIDNIRTVRRSLVHLEKLGLISQETRQTQHGPRKGYKLNDMGVTRTCGSLMDD
jgi:predicted transcriptional regulator